MSLDSWKNFQVRYQINNDSALWLCMPSHLLILSVNFLSLLLSTRLCFLLSQFWLSASHESFCDYKISKWLIISCWHKFLIQWRNSKTQYGWASHPCYSNLQSSSQFCKDSWLATMCYLKWEISSFFLKYVNARN